MEQADSQIGFFGKLPSHGDFVRRALPSEFIKPWDAWLQTGLAASRETLGDTWLDCYLSAPIWRFCLSAGICGEARWVGVIMPSVDRVGRYFPLTTAAPIPSTQSLFGMAAIADSWLGALEEAMLDALEEENLTADAFQKRLAVIEPIDTSAATQAIAEDRQFTEEQGVISLALEGPGYLADAAGNLADTLAKQSLDVFSLWWSSGSEHVRSSVRAYTHLPAEENFWTFFCSDLALD